MLTYSALKRVAFHDGYGSFYCHACAAEEFGALFIEKLEVGLVESDEVSPVIEYNMDEEVSRYAHDTAIQNAQDAGIATDSDEFDRLYEEAQDSYECGGGCGRVYTGGRIPWQKIDNGKVPARVGSPDDNRWTM